MPILIVVLSYIKNKSFLFSPQITVLPLDKSLDVIDQLPLFAAVVLKSGNYILFFCRDVQVKIDA